MKIIKGKKELHNLTLSAMFLAMSFVLPLFTGQIQQIGSMLCPMHIPVLLCGFICGAPWGFLVGFIAPVLRSFIMGMPPMFPTAVSMTFELATYGFIAGLLYNKLPKKRVYVYTILLVAMILGRVARGVALFACLGFDTTKFGFGVFMSTVVLQSVPGIIVQIILVPLIVIAYGKNYKRK